MSQPHFTLTDQDAGESPFLLLNEDGSSRTEYEIYMSKECGLCIHQKGTCPTDEAQGSLHAILLVCPPVLKIKASRKLRVIPKHLLTSFATCSEEALSAMTLPSGDDLNANSTLLGPGDYIQIEEIMLRVGMTELSGTVREVGGTQVRSSNSQALEDEEPLKGTESNVEVQESFHQAEDPLSLPSSRSIQETPSSRQGKLHGQMRSTEEPSQIPEALQEGMQFPVDEESQELLGTEAGYVSIGEVPEEGTNEIERHSAESEEPIFATAQSEAAHVSPMDFGDSISETDSEPAGSSSTVTTESSHSSASLLGKKRQAGGDDEVRIAKKTKTEAPREARKDAPAPRKSSSSISASQPASTMSSVSTPKPALHTMKSVRMTFSYSSIPKEPSIMKFLSKQGARQVEAVTARGVDLLIVGTGALKKTSKLLTAIALGKPIVTDMWITESFEARELIDTAPYVKVIEEFQGGSDRRRLFKGKTIFVTPAMKKCYGSGYGDVESLASLTGAKRIVSKAAEDILKASEKEEVIIIASEEGDVDAKQLIERGRVCYTKDLISTSILRGTLELDDVTLKAKLAVNNQPKVEPKKKTAKAR